LAALLGGLQRYWGLELYLLKIKYTQVLDMPVLTTTPELRPFKKQKSLPQAHRLSKLERKGRQESLIQ
jgi:hypothetical protein